MLCARGPTFVETAQRTAQAKRPTPLLVGRSQRCRYRAHLSRRCRRSFGAGPRERRVPLVRFPRFVAVRGSAVRSRRAGRLTPKRYSFVAHHRSTPDSGHFLHFVDISGDSDAGPRDRACGELPAATSSPTPKQLPDRGPIFCAQGRLRDSMNASRSARSMSTRRRVLRCRSPSRARRGGRSTTGISP